MRWSVLLGMIAGACVSSTAASAEGPYIGIEGGLYLQQPVAYNFVGLSNFFSTKYAKGFDIAGRAGYDFEGIRIETEIGYKRASANEFGFMINGQPLAVQKGSAVSGNLNSISAMVNGYWDITQKRFRPYIGAGVGAARIASDQVGYSGVGENGIFLNTSDVAFAYNLMAGVNARITRHLFVTIGYKYTGVENFRLNVFNTTASSSVHSSSVLIGISYSFGHSITDTPPPPRPPLPLSPAQEAQVDPPVLPLQITFSISFAPGSSLLTEDANATLDQTVLAYQRLGHASLMLMNIQSGTAMALYDEKLASRRANAVKDSLVQKGIPSPAIIVQAFESPQTGPSNSVPPPAAFIMISFGPGSGQ